MQLPVLLDRSRTDSLTNQLVEQLRARVGQGITFFTVMFGDFGPPQTIDLFAREVMSSFA